MKMSRNYIYRTLCFLGFLIGLGYSSNLHAQQDAQFSQYMFNTMAFNPAYAGRAGLLNASLLYRAQWVGFEGAPQTQTLTANTPLKNKSLAIGGSLYNDVLGPEQRFGFYGAFAYRIIFPKSKLSFGVNAGFDVFQGKFTDLDIIDQNDQAFQENIKGKFMPNVGFGVYYFSDKYYVGLSSPKLIQNTIYEPVEGTPSNGKQLMSFYFTAGYVFKINRDVKFKPALLFKFTQNAPAQLDVNLNFLFIDKFWLGAMYRPNSAYGFLFEYQINDQLRFGYSLDISTYELSLYNNGTHEFMLSYDFGYNRTKIRSPRYF
jgi:type IX secretion system PorP/SprF family membrane protein